MSFPHCGQRTSNKIIAEICSVIKGVCASAKFAVEIMIGLCYNKHASEVENQAPFPRKGRMPVSLTGQTLFHFRSYNFSLFFHLLINLSFSSMCAVSNHNSSGKVFIGTKRKNVHRNAL